MSDNGIIFFTDFLFGLIFVLIIALIIRAFK